MAIYTGADQNDERGGHFMVARKSSKERSRQRNALRNLMQRVPEGAKLYAILFSLADPLLEENAAKDRTAAIMGATFLEYALKQAICRCLKSDPEDPNFNYLFDAEEAPYRELAGRIRLARAHGIIDQSGFDQLEAIRLIRNAFAHTMEDVTFQTPEIAAYFNDIRILYDEPMLTAWLDIFAPKHTILGALPSTRASRPAFVYAVCQFFWKLTIWYPDGNPLLSP